LESELRRLGYSAGDVDVQIGHFIWGLFGKGGMMLFGCGNAWKIKFDREGGVSLIVTFWVTCRGGAQYLAIAQNCLKFLRIEYKIIPSS
jgi:hypothetical protein